MTLLCQEFEISRKTGYKWVARAVENAGDALHDRSRRPHRQPGRTAAHLEELVVNARLRFPSWGGRKLRAWLERQGVEDVPSASTITAILRRHHLLDPPKPRPVQVGSFEAPAPNDLWQIDFMGDRQLPSGMVYPFSVLDDHSRFVLMLEAGDNKQLGPVRERLTACFHTYGLPARILSDNGPPWGSSGRDGLTRLEVWWIRLGITVSHGRFYHPQTQGKVERWHGTIAKDVFAFGVPEDSQECQQAFDQFRNIYNLERPHESLAMDVPASRYQPSPRPYPTVLPAPVYAPDDVVRVVSRRGSIGYDGRQLFVGRGLIGEAVAVRPTTTDGVVAVYLAHHKVKDINLHQRRKV